MARKLLHCEVEAMERGVMSFAEDEKDTSILQQKKKKSLQMAEAFASCPDMVVSFSGSLVQLVNFHVYTILLSHLVWLEKFSLSSLEILYNKVKSHSIRFKINKNEINCLYFILHVGT